MRNILTAMFLDILSAVGSDIYIYIYIFLNILSASPPLYICYVCTLLLKYF